MITKLGTTSQLTIRLPRYDPKGQNINTQFTREFEEKCAKEFGENSLQTTVYREMTHSKIKRLRVILRRDITKRHDYQDFNMTNANSIQRDR